MFLGEMQTDTLWSLLGCSYTQLPLCHRISQMSGDPHASVQSPHHHDSECITASSHLHDRLLIFIFIANRLSWFHISGLRLTEVSRVEEADNWYVKLMYCTEKHTAPRMPEEPNLGCLGGEYEAFITKSWRAKHTTAFQPSYKDEDKTSDRTMMVGVLSIALITCK